MGVAEDWWVWQEAGGCGRDRWVWNDQRGNDHMRWQHRGEQRGCIPASGELVCLTQGSHGSLCPPQGGWGVLELLRCVWSQSYVRGAEQV